jgi:thiol-disulfide isomerase/thioredoxin
MAAATIVGFGLVAFPAPRTAAQRFCAACLMAAQNLAAKGAGRAVLKPEKERKPAPDFTLYDASGKPVQLSAFKGKVVLLNFWATWCGGCRVEIPWLIEFQQTYGDRGFVVLGVSLDAEGWKAVKPFIEEKKINYRVMTAPTMLPPVSAPISRCRFRCSSISPAASPQRMLGCPARATTRPRLRRCSVRNGPPQPVRSRFRADSSRA